MSTPLDGLAHRFSELSRRRQMVVGVSIAVIVVFVGGVFGYASQSSRGKAARSAAPLATTTTAAPSTTIAGAVPPIGGGSTTTTAANIYKAVGAVTTEPGNHVFRSPKHCDATGSPAIAQLPSDDKNGAKQWVTVGHVTGACDATSSPFTMKGIDTRLVWRSDSETFTAFVLDSKAGLDATDGYADAECTGPCADSQALVDQAGQYTLKVQADGGPWEVLVQEYR